MKKLLIAILTAFAFGSFAMAEGTHTDAAAPAKTEEAAEKATDHAAPAKKAKKKAKKEEAKKEEAKKEEAKTEEAHSH